MWRSILIALTALLAAPAAAPGGGVTELDRGAISGLRARGTAVAWTRDGEPRSAELP